MKFLQTQLNTLLCDNRSRSVLKAISYQTISTTITFVISFIVTKKVSIALTIGGIDAIAKVVFYYLHERAWHRSSIGRVNNNNNNDPKH